MPSDPLVAVMLMVFLCFVGVLIMFLFVIKNLSFLSSSIKEGTKLQAAAFADIEKQLLDISFSVRNNGGLSSNNQALASEADAPHIMTDSELSSLLTSISGASSLSKDVNIFTEYGVSDRVSYHEESSPLANESSTQNNSLTGNMHNTEISFDAFFSEEKEKNKR